VGVGFGGGGIRGTSPKKSGSENQVFLSPLGRSSPLAREEVFVYLNEKGGTGKLT